MTSFCLGAKVFYKSSVSLSKASDRIESIFFPVDTTRSTDIHFLAECHTKSARELDNEKTFRATCLVNRLSRIRTSPDFFLLWTYIAKYKLSLCLKIGIKCLIHINLEFEVAFLHTKMVFVLKSARWRLKQASYSPTVMNM